MGDGEVSFGYEGEAGRSGRWEKLLGECILGNF